MNPQDIELRLTCHDCPEQYDAFVGEWQVGYLRLRHGEFTVDVPDDEGELIYTGHPKGSGQFEDDERDFYLNEAKDAIVQHFTP